MRVGAQGLDRVRMQARAHHEAPAAVVQLREVGGRRHGRWPLVGRRVRHRQARELGDRRLVLEHHLQPALGDLRLVGRVRRQELRALHEHVDQRRDVVVVHPSAEEAQLLFGRAVPRGQLAQVLEDVLLGAARRQLELPAEAHGRGDLAVEDLLQRGHPDRGQHRLEILRCDGGVAAQVALSLATRPPGRRPLSHRGWPDRPRRPSAPRARTDPTGAPSRASPRRRGPR